MKKYVGDVERIRWGRGERSINPILHSGTAWCLRGYNGTSKDMSEKSRTLTNANSRVENHRSHPVDLEATPSKRPPGLNNHKNPLKTVMAGQQDDLTFTGALGTLERRKIRWGREETSIQPHSCILEQLYAADHIYYGWRRLHLERDFRRRDPAAKWNVVGYIAETMEPSENQGA